MLKTTLAVLLCLSLGACSDAPKFDEMTNKVAPSFSLPTLSGKDLNIESHQGKWRLLVFWASWCPTCVKEVKTLVELNNTMAKKPFKLLSVAVEDKEDVEAFVKKSTINYPVAYGKAAGAKVLAQYGNPNLAVPYMVLIDPQQKIHSTHWGEVPMQTIIDAVN